MPARLQITLHQPHADGSLSAAAVATVRRLADLEGKQATRWWSAEKPVAVVGSDLSLARPTVFELPGGGVYEIEVTRPRGAAITREYRIADGEDRGETIELEASPHEYLSWHQYAGIVRSAPIKRARTRPSPALRSPRLDKLIDQSQARIDSLYRDSGAVPRAFAAKLPAAGEAWRLVTKACRGGSHAWATETPLDDLNPLWDEEYATWLLGAPQPGEGVGLIEALRQPDAPADALAAKYPRWMSFETGGQIDLASMPWAWLGGDTAQGGEIRVVYDRVGASAVDRDRPGHLSVSLLDPRWFGMLEFLASGRLSRTKAMFDEIIEREHARGLFDPDVALSGKAKGPLVATAGAIVLIASAESAEEQRWDPWVRNLSRWFPGIPDGPILLGSRRIAQAASLEELERAFGGLREGVERGIPFFSATIQMLMMSLSQIGGDLPAADELRRFVAPVSSRIDPDQVFTVIRL